MDKIITSAMAVVVGLSVAQGVFIIKEVNDGVVLKAINNKVYAQNTPNMIIANKIYEINSSNEDYEIDAFELCEYSREINDRKISNACDTLNIK